MGIPEKHANFLLQTLLDHIPDSIYFKDRQSRFILINQAAARSFHLESPAKAVGKTDFDIFAQEHACAAFADEQEILRTGIPLIAKEEKETWPNGNITWAMTTKMPLRNSHAEIIGTFGFSRNISERMGFMDQMAEQAALIDIAPDAIMVCDLRSTIRFWNKGAEQVYGWTRQEALGQTAAELLFPKRNPARHDEILRAVLSQGTWKGDVNHVTKENKSLIVESKRTLVRDAQGRPQSILIINTDVTQLRRISAVSLNAQRLESIGTLAAGIAHDLNNVLAPILMSIDLLKLSAKDSQFKTITAIETSAKRGAAIVKQLLSSARGMDGERIQVQVAHVCKEIEQIVQNTFPKNIQWQMSIPCDLWTIQGDPTQLHQVLLNFCLNARDAMPDGGRLTLTAENRSLDENDAAINPLAKPGHYILLCITDTGTGIDPEVLDRIFEPFFTTKEIGKGTGLGLSMTMGIVKGHGGFINVYSELGKGSNFKVYLAAEADHEASHRRTQPVRLRGGNGETILVVDDDNSVLEVTSHMLQAFGYRVLTASNGAEAMTLYQLQRGKIAAVITDMTMPFMDGPSLIHALKSINPEVRIIAASGLHSDENMAQLDSVGIKYYLHKPAAAGTLLELLRKALTETQALKGL